MSTVESLPSVRTVSIGRPDPVSRPGPGEPSRRPIVMVDCRPMSCPAAEPPNPTAVAHLVQPTDLVLLSADQQWDMAGQCSAGRAVVGDGSSGSASAFELAETIASMFKRRIPSWLGLSAAADILGQVSETLGDQQWGEEGTVTWSGWGGPSIDLISAGPPRWTLRYHRPSGDTAAQPIRIDAPIWGFAAGDLRATGGTDESATAGAHLMVDRLPARGRERLAWLAALWAGVVPDGLMAFTYPVDAGSKAIGTESVGPEEILVDHQRMVEELLVASSGRVLTHDLTIHGRSSTDLGVTWATLVLRRLGP